MRKSWPKLLPMGKAFVAGAYRQVPADHLA